MAVDVIARGIAGAAQVGLAQANEKIDRLEGKTTRILYSAKTNPTATEIGDFVNSLGYTSPYEGVAVVIAGTYHIWHYYENDSIGWRDDGVDTITPFTNTVPGSILGSVDDGKISANNDGTGSVNGWSNKLDKQTGATSYWQVYTKLGDGTQQMTNCSDNTVLPTSIVVRNSNGQVACADPTGNTHAVTLYYANTNYLAKNTEASGYTIRLYSTTQSGGAVIQTMTNASPGVYGGAVVLRDSVGQIAVPDTPTSTKHATSKAYVDNKLTATLTQLSDGTYSLTFGV